MEEVFVLEEKLDDYYDALASTVYLFKTKEDAIYYLQELIENWRRETIISYDYSEEDFENDLYEFRRDKTYYYASLEDCMSYELSITEKPIMTFDFV
jgi:hypothetical protein